MILILFYYRVQILCKVYIYNIIRGIWPNNRRISYNIYIFRHFPLDSYAIREMNPFSFAYIVYIEALHEFGGTEYSKKHYSGNGKAPYLDANVMFG